jgi:hypothetical protein
MEKAREVMNQVFALGGKNWTEEDQAILEYAAATAEDVEGE